MKKTLESLKINRTKELAHQIGVPLDVIEAILKEKDKHYTKRTWQDKKGKSRDFYQASPELEAIHAKLLKNLLYRLDIPVQFQGAIKGRSLSSHAQIHSNKKNIAVFDIKRFFPSVKPEKVFFTFRDLGCQPDVANMIRDLVTAEGHLPQGFKTSPLVSVLVLGKTDRRLQGFLKKFGFKHSFWIDDLTVSGNSTINASICNYIKKLFERDGFTVHKDEDNPVNQSERQTVTKTVVNKKPNLIKQKREEVEKAVYICGIIGIRDFRRQHYPNLTLGQVVDRVSGQISHYVGLRPDKRSLFEEWSKLREISGL
ncbi:MAG: hypothetical protein RLZZ347_174 [Candidatus Parcubacteria bacterium]|jgi:hypothetical protein